MTSATVNWAAALCACAATPVVADTAISDTAIAAGNWVKVFSLDVERALGRSTRIDTTSVVAGGIGRTFREAQVMLNASGRYARGSTAFLARSVDCRGSRVVTTQWRVIGPTGTVLGTSTGVGTVGRVVWDSEDGKVLRYVCRGILPR